jgi:hypothetical protein
VNAPASPPGIGTLNEGPLHAAIKEWYREDGDRFEVSVDGREIDLVRGDLLIEIQTGTFTPLRRKLERLLDEHRVRVVHPVPHHKWIVRVEGDEQRVLGRRKSPFRGRLFDAFEQLVGIAKVLDHPNLSVALLSTREEEVRRLEPGRARRRKGWVIVERRLVNVIEGHVFETATELARLLPEDLPHAFTTADLAERLGIARDLAQKMAYCLRHAGALRDEGKRGNARLYSIGLTQPAS